VLCCIICFPRREHAIDAPEAQLLLGPQRVLRRQCDLLSHTKGISSEILGLTAVTMTPDYMASYPEISICILYAIRQVLLYAVPASTVFNAFLTLLITVVAICTRVRGNTVVVVTRLRAGCPRNRDTISGRYKRRLSCPKDSRPALGAHSVSYSVGIRCSFLGGPKRPGRETDHSRPFSAEISSGELSLLPPLYLHGVHRGKFLVCPLYVVCELYHTSI
jgi:hypothetical protein